MIDIDTISIVSAKPEVIHRTGATPKITLKLLELEKDEAAMIPTDSQKDHKAAQRTINVITKKLKKSAPGRSYVTRTIYSEGGGFMLGVFRTV